MDAAITQQITTASAMPSAKSEVVRVSESIKRATMQTNSRNNQATVVKAAMNRLLFLISEGTHSHFSLQTRECAVEDFEQKVGVLFVDAHWRRKTDCLSPESALAEK